MREFRFGMNPPLPDPDGSGYVDVTVVEFAAHTAYLDPAVGTGFLVTPRPETDVEAPEDALVEAAWSLLLSDPRPQAGLSLQLADKLHALSELEREGWKVLHDEHGNVENAGVTIDGCVVVCLYDSRSLAEPTLDELHRSLTALSIAADLQPRSGD